MRRLIVMRHAKSSWDDPASGDRDRSLNARGRLAAVLMGAWLEEEGLWPDHALVSDASRSRETWDRVVRGAGREGAATVTPALYMADAEATLGALRTAPDAARTVLAVGHEPGLSAFARRLADGSEGAGARRAYDKFVTAAAAVFELPDAPWSEVAFGTARFARFTAPKDLV